MKRRRKIGLAGDQSYHENMADARLKSTAVQLDEVEAAAKRKDCGEVWDHLLAAIANWTSAGANIDAIIKPAKSMTNMFFTLNKRFHHLRDTLGFQCTRRHGGIR
jgi:hypothetical protein